MPTLKQLPALGDSNWGTPLNNYIAQTTDNTKGGAFNSFTNFVDRPLASNLTADDKGKTYLNTKTGNFHQWSGTKWEILNSQSFVNLLDFGAIPDYTTDCTPAMQAALDYCATSGVAKIYIPSGSYRMEITVDGSIAIEIFGDGQKARDTGTLVSAVNPGGYAFTFCCAGVIQKLTGMSIWGFNNGYTSNDRNGTRHIKIGTAPQNSNLVGIIYNDVTFRNCIVGIKIQAAFYFRLTECKFLGGDFGIYGIGEGASYSGFDSYDNCGFFGIEKACVYYNNTNAFGENNTTFTHCWFEGNFGITCLAIKMGGTNSLMFDHCWFESNAIRLNQDVVIDGNTYQVKEIIFSNTKGCIQYSELPKGIKLMDKSQLKLDFVKGNEAHPGLNAIEYDATSYVDCRTVGEVPAGGYGGGTSFMSDFGMLGFNSVNGGLNFYKSKNNRPTLTRKYINAFPNGTFSSRTYPAYIDALSAGVTAQIITDDGMHNNRSLKVTLPNVEGSKMLIAADYTINNPGFAGKDPDGVQFVVTTFAIKAVDGHASLAIGNDTTGASGNLFITDKKWHTYCGISSGSATGGINIRNNENTNTIILVSKLQLVGFPTYQEAADYIKSDFYALPQDEPMSWHGDSIPTTGNHVKGDVIYNTMPMPGGYMGWVCTQSGAPGTWKGFGLIQI
jgi:Pectate lyase superfamily protein